MPEIFHTKGSELLGDKISVENKTTASIEAAGEKAVYDYGAEGESYEGAVRFAGQRNRQRNLVAATTLKLLAADALTLK